MNKLLAALAITTTIAAVSPAIAADTVSYEAKTTAKKDSDGNVKKTFTEESKDAAGTKTTTEVEGKVDVDSDGTTTKTVTTETSKDPKGLMNKETTKTTDKVKVDEHGKVKTSHKKEVNGDTVVDTESKTH